jgi:hypothetical protein
MAESESPLIGRDFGIGTEIKTGLKEEPSPVIGGVK